MALNKQPVSINFAKGLQTKTDPYQVPVGNFLALNNSVFTTEGRLTKRNGYNNSITALPNAQQTTLTTLNDNLIATGSDLYSYNANSKEWIDKGLIQPVQLSTQALVRVSTSQSAPDSAVNAAGLVCLVYEDNGQAYYQFSDSDTGEQLVTRTALPANSSIARVALLGQFFIITFYTVISGVTHLQYIAIPQSMPQSPRSVVSITTSIRDAQAGYDIVSANNNLYIATATGANTIELRQLTSTLVMSSANAITGHTANLMSLTVDQSMSTLTLWVTFWDGTNVYSGAYNHNRLQILAPVQIMSAVNLNELTSEAQELLCTVLAEVNNTYGSGPNAAVKTDYIQKATITQSGTASSPVVILRSVGLASKAFIGPNNVIYTLVAYGESQQPTYFLIDSDGNIYMRLAYSNGGGYETTQVLPTVSEQDGVYSVPYLIKDLLVSVSKDQNSPNSSNIYTQTGINLASFTINSSQQYSSEIARALHLTGGQLWEYDSVKPVEHGFQIWPENIGATPVDSGGTLANQQYFYQFTYEWTDNQGMLHRSAPSIPLSVDLTNEESVGATFTSTFAEGVTAIPVSSIAGILVGQTILDTTQPDAIASATTVVSLGSLFSAVFTTGSTTVTVSSTSGLFVGQTLVDTTTPSNLAANTTIATIPNSTTITISTLPTGNSAGTPGDVIRASSISNPTITLSNATLNFGTGDTLTASPQAHLAAFSAGTKFVYVDDATAYRIGQTLSDLTNPSAFTTPTTVTAIDLANNKLTTDTATAAQSSGIALSTAVVNFSAMFSINSTVLTVSSTAGLHVGQYITDSTTPSTLPANTYITAIGSTTITISNQTVNGSAASPGDSLHTVATTFNASTLVGNTHIPVSSANNLYVGQTIVDTSGTVPGGTTIATIDSANNVITLSAATTISHADTTSIDNNLSVVLTVPTLRLTYKVQPNPVRIVGYRWSVAQQAYYQFTSITAPVVNNPAVDYVTITDTASDASILGNTLIYTTGGVVENIAAPASVDTALFNNRLFLIDAEDRNLLWFSKQVIEAVPVEMSDLLTVYVAPTSGAQGSTGPMTALGAMDDKLIIFKKDAIYYINGNGPDNTGANSTFSDPIFITSSVGCAVPASIVLMPQGLMFQSDKGIWILGRDLSTNYIGAAVEQYNTNTVMSAQSIPATNQVRFVLDNNITLMYDYFYAQWGTFSNTFAISSTLYRGIHTYLNKFGTIFHEAPGAYLDGSSPVLMSFTTSWINVAGLQGFERLYFANLLGTYYTPFTLNVDMAYDYNPSATQSIVVSPDNYVAPWGEEALWGSGGNWGGPGNVFTARMFPDRQKCQSFQVTITEQYDATLGAPSGQGLTLSGLALVIGVKKGYRTQSAAKSFGGG